MYLSVGFFYHYVLFIISIASNFVPRAESAAISISAAGTSEGIIYKSENFIEVEPKGCEFVINYSMISMANIFYCPC
jgi:hypothetical protein